MKMNRLSLSLSAPRGLTALALIGFFGSCAAQHFNGDPQNPYNWEQTTLLDEDHMHERLEYTGNYPYVLTTEQATYTFKIPPDANFWRRNGVQTGLNWTLPWSQAVGQADTISLHYKWKRTIKLRWINPNDQPPSSVRIWVKARAAYGTGKPTGSGSCEDGFHSALTTYPGIWEDLFGNCGEKRHEGLETLTVQNGVAQLPLDQEAQASEAGNFIGDAKVRGSSSLEWGVDCKIAEILINGHHAYGPDWNNATMVVYPVSWRQRTNRWNAYDSHTDYAFFLSPPRKVITYTWGPNSNSADWDLGYPVRSMTTWFSAAGGSSTTGPGDAGFTLTGTSSQPGTWEWSNGPSGYGTPIDAVTRVYEGSYDHHQWREEFMTGAYIEFATAHNDRGHGRQTTEVLTCDMGDVNYVSTRRIRYVDYLTKNDEILMLGGADPGDRDDQVGMSEVTLVPWNTGAYYDYSPAPPIVKMAADYFEVRAYVDGVFAAPAPFLGPEVEAAAATALLLDTTFALLLNHAYPKETLWRAHYSAYWIMYQDSQGVMHYGGPPPIGYSGPTIDIAMLQWSVVAQPVRSVKVTQWANYDEYGFQWVNETEHAPQSAPLGSPRCYYLRPVGDNGNFGNPGNGSQNSGSGDG